MNGRQRRATGDRDRLAELQRLAACPDCTADVSVVKVTPGVYRGVVRHDSTCPWFAAFTRNTERERET